MVLCCLILFLTFLTLSIESRRAYNQTRSVLEWVLRCLPLISPTLRWRLKISEASLVVSHLLTSWLSMPNKPRVKRLSLNYRNYGEIERLVICTVKKLPEFMLNRNQLSLHRLTLPKMSGNSTYVCYPMTIIKIIQPGSFRWDCWRWLM